MIDLANDPLYKAAVAKHWADKKAAAETPLAKFLEPSEVKQRMYHGTARDISQFKPKQAGATFVTPDPKFAHTFADASKGWMNHNPEKVLTKAQLKESYKLPRNEQAYHQELHHPSAQNIMPVHVQAKNPFDYDNPKHVEAVHKMLHKRGHSEHSSKLDYALNSDDSEDANWEAIESKPVQQAIRALGHDSFWVKEGGVKNLGVYNPGAIKSAIGNRGTYDTEDYDVNKAQGGAVHLAAGKSVEPPPYRVYRGTTAGTMLSNAPYTHFAHKPEVAAGAERGYLSPEFLQSVGMDPALARVPKDLAVYPADVRIRKPAGPKEVNKHAPNAKTVQEAFPILHKAGYDGYVDNYQVVPFEHHQIKSAFEKAQGGAVKPVKLKEGQQPPYQDPKTSKIDDWKWHPMERIRQELSARRELPEHVTPYADYMREMNAKAQRGELTPRDLVKAYTITQSSIGRGGLSHSTATKRGMKLPNTGGEVRPEGAFAEWLGSPMGQKYLEASMRGEEHPEAMEDLRAKFAPFGKQNAQVEAMQYATQNAPSLGERLNKAITGSKADYRKYAGGIKGIAGAKSGFIGSLLGRGDLPTLDARQLNLHSLSHPTKTPEGMMSRGKGLGGQEAVDRLIARQDALGYKIPKELAPYAQHLIHHDVWDQRGGTQTTHKDLIKAMLGYADGGDVGEGRIPLDLPKAPVPSRQEMQAIVDRIARQQAGEFVKGASTPNLAGRSLKEFERIQKVPYSLKPTKQLRPTPVYHAQKGDVNIVVPGDLTVSDKMLEHVNDTPIGSQQEGGSQYGEGKLDMPEDKRPFWASGLGAARAFQNKVTKLARLTGEDPRVIAYHLAMASEGNNFAMHLADANLKAIKNSKIAPENVDTFNRVIRAGSKATGSFPDFPGVHLPEESYAAMQKDSEMRKFFNNRMKTPTITKPLGLPNGLDIDWAVSHPELRNMEINMTGHSVGRMKPGAELIPGSAHKTYSHDIPGESLGRAPELAPLELSFLDATHFLRQPGQMTSPGAYTRTMSLGAPHQVVDDRYLNMMNDYYTKLRAARGFAKGGNVSMDEMLAHTTLGKKAPNVRNIGADEAPDMKVKQYISPGPGKGNTLPAGGVDFQPEMPGHQLTQAAPAGPGGPAMPGMPGMPPGGLGMPPGGPGMPGMPPPLPRNQPGMPTGKPAGLEPPNIPPPKQKPTGSNILSMTPQGQALAALGPMRKMADGGSVEQMKRELAQKKNIRLFHGSHEKNLSAVNDKGTFGGVFGHPSKNAALSHGENVYHTDVPEDKVFKIGHNVPQRKMRDFINAQFPGSKHKEELADHLIHGTSLFKSSIPEEELLKATRSDDIGEADWDMQRRRGLLAKSLGYHAAEMPDEHGTSYLVLPGASLTRHMADGGSVPKKQAPVKQRNVYDLLRKFGRMATSTEDAERALSNGDRVFYGHDMEEDKPTEVRNTGDMRGYTSDQIIILPARHMADGGPVASRAFQEVEAPKKTTKAYKLFRTHPKHPGKLFPLFVDANEPVEQGKWLAAQAGESAGEKVKSKIGPLAYRPGWHGGDLPIATHIGSKSTSRLKKPDIRPDNHVWAEVEMPNDVDWHSEAQRRGTNAQGRVVPVKAHITDQVPTGGHYRYKTNANMTGNWLIGGSMKVNRVLPDKEVAAINKAAGVADLPRRKMADGGSVKHMAGGSLRDKILQDAGVYGARRFERALDEIPNLQQMYSAKALHSAFTGDNAKAIMTMDPAHFENYATPIIESLTGHKDPTVIKHLGEKFAVPTSEHIKHLATILRKGGFDDVPFLGLDKEEVGLPLMPFIKGHEGRHRSRALTQTGVTKNLVRLLPRAELREPLPRRSQEEYIAALKAELDKNGLVRPEPAGMRQERREPVRLPDIYRGGGGVTLPPSTEQMRQALSARRSNSKA